MKITVNLNNDESKIFNDFADESSKKIPVLTMQSVITTVLYDLEDLKAYLKAMAKFEKDPVTYTHAEIKEMFGLT